MLRRIKTQSEVNAKKKRNQIIIGVVLIGLLVVSTAGYAFFNTDDDKEETTSVTYNGLEFFRGNGYWVTEISQETFAFQYLPDELENVSIMGIYNLADYSGKPLYFVNDNAASSEILQNIERYILRNQEACLGDCEGNFPIKNCSENLIIFNVSENLESSVYQRDNCVFIEGNLIRGSDMFLYRLFGIK